MGNRNVRTTWVAAVVAAVALLAAPRMVHGQSGPNTLAPNAAAATDTRNAATTHGTIAPDAQPLLEKVTAAYAQLSSLRLSGIIETEVNYANKPGEAREFVRTFTSSFRAPGRFRHELEDKLVVGHTGDRAFAYNPRANTYVMADASPAVNRLVETQNPSLWLALSGDVRGALAGKGRHVTLLRDILIDKVDHPVLGVTIGEDMGPVELAIDPETYLIRRLVADLTEWYRAGGGPEINRATLIIDYTDVEPGARFGPGRFEWSPPEGATGVAAARDVFNPDLSGPDSLVGKPAPAFTLYALDGRAVSLGDYAGQVLLLDFWATWCPPCVEFLPHLGRLYREKSDGVAILAINVLEGTDEVRDFAARHDIDVPVLLDQGGNVANRYGVGTIPQSVLIGPDGKVVRVFRGMGTDLYTPIKQAIERLRPARARDATPAAATSR